MAEDSTKPRLIRQHICYKDASLLEGDITKGIIPRLQSIIDEAEIEEGQNVMIEIDPGYEEEPEPEFTIYTYRYENGVEIGERLSREARYKREQKRIEERIKENEHAQYLKLRKIYDK
jgi:hypothetical protein